MMTDLHWTEGMLNPTLRGWAPLHEHDQSRRILNRVFRKLAPDDETYVRVLNQYQDFLENKGSFQEAVVPFSKGHLPMSGGMQWVVKPKLFKLSQDKFLHRCVPYRPVSGIEALTCSYTTKSATAFNLVVQRI